MNAWEWTEMVNGWIQWAEQEANRRGDHAGFWRLSEAWHELHRLRELLLA